MFAPRPPPQLRVLQSPEHRSDNISPCVELKLLLKEVLLRKYRQSVMSYVFLFCLNFSGIE